MIGDLTCSRCGKTPKDVGSLQMVIVDGKEICLKCYNEPKPDDGITCPFCGEDDFDKMGLKWHLNTHCEVYRETENLKSIF